MDTVDSINPDLSFFHPCANPDTKADVEQGIDMLDGVTELTLDDEAAFSYANRYLAHALHGVGDEPSVGQLLEAHGIRSTPAACEAFKVGYNHVFVEWGPVARPRVAYGLGTRVGQMAKQISQ